MRIFNVSIIIKNIINAKSINQLFKVDQVMTKMMWLQQSFSNALQIFSISFKEHVGTFTLEWLNSDSASASSQNHVKLSRVNKHDKNDIFWKSLKSADNYHQTRLPHSILQGYKAKPQK